MILGNTIPCLRIVCVPSLCKDPALRLRLRSIHMGDMKGLVAVVTRRRTTLADQRYNNKRRCKQQAPHHR